MSKTLRSVRNRGSLSALLAFLLAFAIGTTCPCAVVLRAYGWFFCPACDFVFATVVNADPVVRVMLADADGGEVGGPVPVPVGVEPVEPVEA